jgi:hypothetical protein
MSPYIQMSSQIAKTRGLWVAGILAKPFRRDAWSICWLASLHEPAIETHAQVLRRPYGAIRAGPVTGHGSSPLLDRAPSSNAEIFRVVTDGRRNVWRPRASVRSSNDAPAIVLALGPGRLVCPTLSPLGA